MRGTTEMKRKLLVVCLIAMLCLLPTSCKKEEETVLTCSNCGKEIRIPGKGGMITEALYEGKTVLCDECSNPGFSPIYY